MRGENDRGRESEIMKMANSSCANANQLGRGVQYLTQTSLILFEQGLSRRLLSMLRNLHAWYGACIEHCQSISAFVDVHLVAVGGQQDDPICDIARKISGCQVVVECISMSNRGTLIRLVAFHLRRRNADSRWGSPTFMVKRDDEREF